MEPDRDRRRPPVPRTGSGRWPSIRTASSPATPTPGQLPAGEDAAAAERAIRMAAHRTLRVVTDGVRGLPVQHDGRPPDGAGQHAVPLPRDGGRRRAAWDEAIRLLLLMLAPAAPHITEELWSPAAGRGRRPWTSIHTESWPEVDAVGDRRRDPRGADPGQRQGPRPGRRPGRHRAGRARAHRARPRRGSASCSPGGRRSG